MKILTVGEGRSELHEVAVASAFRHLDHEVVLFPWSRFFNRTTAVGTLASRLQNKLLFGPTILALNRELLRISEDFGPDIVFIYRGTHILRSTLAKMKKIASAPFIIGYNNDDPFSAAHFPLLWRHFKRCIPFYDLVLAYRQHNVAAYLEKGAKEVRLLRSWFLPELHCVPSNEHPPESIKCDVIFVGHFENDSRCEHLKMLAEHGIDLKVFGPDWDAAPSSPWLDKFQPVRPLRGSDYVRAIGSAKIALCFLSKLNRDTYTRRSFEIPAIGTMMLSEYTEDMAAMFEEGVDAEYFRSPQELLAKVERYLADEPRRLSIAAAGKRRVVADGHDIYSRMKQVIAWVEEIKSHHKKS